MNSIKNMNWKHILVNGLTISRIILCPILVCMLVCDYALSAANWLLAFAFLTDFLDGFLARRLKATSELGCKLDSFADDLLFCTSILYIKYLYPEIISQHIFAISAASVIFFSKMLLLWYKHKKLISGMHTYLTKVAAFFQALFFLHALFLGPWAILFKIACGVTILSLIEEIVIIATSSQLHKNVKGIFFKKYNQS